MRCTPRGAAVLILLLSNAVTAAAGQAPVPADPAENPRVQVGPLSLNPRVELLNVGVDSNVFDEAESPKDDFTATFRPSLDATLRFGPGRLTYRGRLDAVYFRRYKNERSVNRFGEVRAEARLARFIPFVSAGGVETRERPNSEIDLRARRSVQSLGAGATLIALSRTSIVGEVHREIARYEEDQFYRSENLAQQLDETRETAQGGVRIALTPLTTLSMIAIVERDRFDLSPERDGNTLRIAPTLSFDPAALLSGTVTLGYRRFTPLSDTMPPFRGFVAQVATRYTLLGRTRFDVRFNRDIDFSYDSNRPYYLRTGGTLTITQLLVGPLDAQVVGGREQLEYRDVLEAHVPETGDERMDLVGGGIGYRLAETTRIGVNVEFTRRHAQIPSRSFDRRRIVGSVSYGF